MDPLRLSFAVACSVEHAWETWTRRASLWWPAGHTVAGEPGLEIVFEPRCAGRIFERTQEGREEDWGEILTWEPPRRLTYLWHLRADRADATEARWPSGSGSRAPSSSSSLADAPASPRASR